MLFVHGGAHRGKVTWWPIKWWLCTPWLCHSSCTFAKRQRADWNWGYTVQLRIGSMHFCPKTYLPQLKRGERARKWEREREKERGRERKRQYWRTSFSTGTNLCGDGGGQISKVKKCVSIVYRLLPSYVLSSKSPIAFQQVLVLLDLKCFAHQDMVSETISMVSEAFEI